LLLTNIYLFSFLDKSFSGFILPIAALILFKDDVLKSVLFLLGGLDRLYLIKYFI